MKILLCPLDDELAVAHYMALRAGSAPTDSMGEVGHEDLTAGSHRANPTFFIHNKKNARRCLN